MNKNAEDFKQEFPELLRDVRCDFSLPPGWDFLVWEALASIKHHVKYKRYKEPEFNPKVEQVKEKFGTLRIYLSGGDDITTGYIDMACSLSALFCLTCGTRKDVSFGKDGFWLNTRCSTCREKNERGKSIYFSGNQK